MTLETLQIILPYSVILAAIGLIESLLTLTVLDEMTNTRGKSNRECMGQGLCKHYLFCLWRYGWLCDDRSVDD